MRRLCRTCLAVAILAAWFAVLSGSQEDAAAEVCFPAAATPGPPTPSTMIAFGAAQCTPTQFINVTTDICLQSEPAGGGSGWNNVAGTCVRYYAPSEYLYTSNSGPRYCGNLYRSRTELPGWAGTVAWSNQVAGC
jgi:hypothetical protein